MSKWRKVSPDQIKAGDLVKVRHVSDAYEETTSAVATNVTDLEIGVGPYSLYKDKGTWYIAKPKKAKPELSPTEKAWFTMPTISEPYTPPFPPPTRPDEPPVGLIFRVDRTGELYLRMHEGNGDYGYVSLLGDREGDLCTWTDITDHGDTITLLELTEKGDKKDGGV